MREGDLVVVGWLDAVGPVDLAPGDQLRPAKARTVGWVIAKKTGYITLAAEMFEDGHARAVTTIPRGMIHDIDVVQHATD